MAAIPPRSRAWRASYNGSIRSTVGATRGREWCARNSISRQVAAGSRSNTALPLRKWRSIARMARSYNGSIR